MSQTHAVVDLLAFCEAVGQGDTIARFSIERGKKLWSLVIWIDVAGTKWQSRQALARTLDECVSTVTREASQWLRNQSLS